MMPIRKTMETKVYGRERELICKYCGRPFRTCVSTADWCARNDCVKPVRGKYGK